MKRILVTGAGGPAASNFVHSLRLAPERFFVVGTDSSKYHLELADLHARYLLPRAREPGYLEELNAVLERERIDLVHPQPDLEVLALGEHRDKLMARTFLPSLATLELCYDKAGCARRIAESGLPTPRSFAVDSETSLRQATETILSSHSKAWVRAVRGAGARASLPVSSPDQAVGWVRFWTEEKGLTYGDFMVSQFLPGREFAFQSLWLEGELVTSQARERLEYVFGHLTPSGQTSSPSVARTVHRGDVNELAAACVRAIDLRATGVFCVDLKEDEREEPLLTEVNAGRFFTTSNFLAAAGANMPYTYVRLALGEPVDGLPKFNAVEAGLYWVRMMDMGFRLVREGEWSARQLSHQ